MPDSQRPTPQGLLAAIGAASAELLPSSERHFVRQRVRHGARLLLAAAATTLAASAPQQANAQAPLPPALTVRPAAGLSARQLADAIAVERAPQDPVAMLPAGQAAVLEVRPGPRAVWKDAQGREIAPPANLDAAARAVAARAVRGRAGDAPLASGTSDQVRAAWLSSHFPLAARQALTPLRVAGAESDDVLAAATGEALFGGDLDPEAVDAALALAPDAATRRTYQAAMRLHLRRQGLRIPDRVAELLDMPLQRQAMEGGAVLAAAPGPVVSRPARHATTQRPTRAAQPAGRSASDGEPTEPEDPVTREVRRAADEVATGVVDDAKWSIRSKIYSIEYEIREKVRRSTRLP